MLYLVDGYNVTHGDPATTSLSLEDQRDALVARLRVRGGDLLGRGRIVVVFDAQHGVGGSAVDTAPIEVVWARKGTADDEIVRIASGQKGAVVVVSNDLDLIERVRGRVERRLEPREGACCFEGARAPVARTARKGSTPRDGGLPRGANAITREMKALWLDGTDNSETD